MLDVAIDIERGLPAHHVLWFRKDILNKRARHDAQGDFAINSAERQVVDLVAEGGNISAFRRINVDSQHIFTVEVDVWRQVEGKRRVPTLIFSELLTIDPDGRSRHHAFKIDEHMLSLRLRRQLESSSID